MSSPEWVVMGLKSGAASAHVTRHFVAISGTICYKYEFRILNSGFLG